jgi:hypothetical protein
MTKRTTAGKSIRTKKTAKRHDPPSLAQMRFQVVKRGTEYFVTSAGAAVAGPYKSREAAQRRADEMETRAAK